jgi:hypothetical protein
LGITSTLTPKLARESVEFVETIETEKGTVLPTPAEIRTWARSQGLSVGERGRLKPEIHEAYSKAHGDAPTQVRAQTPARAKKPKARAKGPHTIKWRALKGPPKLYTGKCDSCRWYIQGLDNPRNRSMMESNAELHETRNV